jgi:hypothetical protein
MGLGRVTALIKRIHLPKNHLMKPILYSLNFLDKNDKQCDRFALVNIYSYKILIVNLGYIAWPLESLRFFVFEHIAHLELVLYCCGRRRG